MSLGWPGAQGKKEREGASWAGSGEKQGFSPNNLEKLGKPFLIPNLL
jgi:hypothetical protein